MEIEKVCRLCGAFASKSMYSIFSKNNNGQQLIQLIKQCLPILVYRTDPLSKKICGKCYTKLNEYSDFQKITITVHDNFRNKLLTETNESVRLYVDTLENAYQPENIQITNYRSIRPVRNCACQIKVETRSSFTSTVPHSENTTSTSIPNLKILTPSIINEKSGSANTFVSSVSDDGSVLKKRRVAGPKSKTRHQNIKYNPLTLLQCTLKEINRNLTENIEIENENLQTESADSCLQEDEIYLENMALMEPSIHLTITEQFIDTEKYEYDNINLDESIVCNYCMKSYKNIIDLAEHELKHIKVDIGPRVDTKEFNVRCRKLASYYQNYLARQSTPKEMSLPVEKAVNVPKLIVEKKESAYNKATRRTERIQHIVDDANSLLVPQVSSSDCVFEIENNEILINGIPLKSMQKQQRRMCYKDMLINGVKRKYCPLCRHTFKDSWAIENHYLNDICLYTCKYCGQKFKYQKELFEIHLENHKGEPVNKIFGPTNRKFRLKKKRLVGTNRSVYVGQVMSTSKKVKSVKIRHLVHKKVPNPPVQIKSEPDLPVFNDNDSVTLQASGSRTEPYQAYFCRKCFKVFFNVTEYNTHIRVCSGQKSNKNAVNSKSSGTYSDTYSKRPVRSCVKEITAIDDSDDGESEEVYNPKKSKIQKTPETGWECGICCSSFPSRQSRNSHMRIHKGHTQNQKTILNKNSPKTHAITKSETQPVASNYGSNTPRTTNNSNPEGSNIRLANLNPAVARLVQNNPHLTIRSYSKSQPEKYSEPATITVIESPQNNFAHPGENTPEHNIKRVYKCADCEDRFENKSILYYHKMNACKVKRHYECAFCRKKFGTYDQYNTHMFYVHPE